MCHVPNIRNSVIRLFIIITSTVFQLQAATVADTIPIVSAECNEVKMKYLPVTVQNCSIEAFDGFQLLVFEAIPRSKE
jgi:hypothetical protein